MARVSLPKPGRRKHAGDEIPSDPGRRWHLPALPTTLAKLDSISATTLTRLLLRSQASRKEKRPHIHTQSTPTRCRMMQRDVATRHYNQSELPFIETYVLFIKKQASNG